MTPAAMRTCPDPATIRDFLLGVGAPDELAELETHFADCPACDETIRNHGARDDFSDMVSAAMAGTANEGNGRSADSDAPFVARLVDHFQRELSADLVAVEDERAAEVFRYLEAQSKETASPPYRMAQYQLGEFLGAGATSVVFRATDTELGRDVAIKILRPSLGEFSRQRFLSEARAAASISHPNVVSILHVGKAADLAFIVMPWIHGETLESRLACTTFLPEDQARQIAVQVASGLHAAHAQGLIHRDIKPANIWLSQESGEAIIIDFGLARIVDDDPRLTHSGVLAGTPHYMSPEQSRGQELDGRSDLFSLGCTLYRAVTGKFPFGASGALATLQAIQHHQPLAPCSINPHISEPFSELIMHLLDKQPLNRPDSATALIKALERDRDGAIPIIPRPADSGKRESSASIRQISGSGTRIRNGLLVACLLGAMGWFGWMAVPQIIRIITNHGELVIDSDDPNVRIELLSGGEVVRVIDTQAGRSVDIVAGEYQIRPGTGSEGSEVIIQPDQLTMTRGGKQVVSVRKAGSKSVPSTSISPGVSSTNPPFTTRSSQAWRPDAAPVFNGRSFSEWKSIVDNERNPAIFQAGLLGLATLAGDHPERQETAIQALIPLIRKWRLLEWDRQSLLRNQNQSIPDATNSFVHWPVLFANCLRQLSGERIFRLVVDETREGNEQSLEFIATYLTDKMYRMDDERASQFRDALRQKLPELLALGMDRAERAESSSELDSIFQLCSNCLDHGFREFDRVKGTSALGPLPSDVHELLDQKFHSTNCLSTRVWIGTVLLNYSNNPTLYVEHLQDLRVCKYVLDEKLAVLNTSDAIVQSLLIGPILQSLRSEQLIQKFASEPDAVEALYEVYFRSRREPGMLSNALPHELILQATFCRIFQRWGATAKDALPWIDEVAVSSQPQVARVAREAADSIRASLPQGNVPDTTNGVTAPGEIEPSDDGIDQPLRKGSMPAPLYNGRSFDQWKRLLENDRSPAIQQEGLLAMAHLSHENPERQEIVLQLLIPFIRKTGVRESERDSAALVGMRDSNTVTPWPTIFSRCLGQLPPDRVCQFMIDETRDGNLNSLEFLWQRSSSGEIYADDPASVEVLHGEWRRRLPEILDVALQRVERDPMSLETDAILEACFSRLRQINMEHGALGQETGTRPLDASIRDPIIEKLRGQCSTTTQVWIGNVILFFDLDPAVYLQFLNQTDVPPCLLLRKIQQLVQLKDDQAGPFVVPLVNACKSPTFIPALARDNSVVGFLENRFVRPRAFGSASASQPPLPEESVVRMSICRLFGGWGAVSKDALPWLDEMADSDDPQVSTFAKIAARDIRKALGEENSKPAGEETKSTNESGSDPHSEKKQPPR